MEGGRDRAAVGVVINSAPPDSAEAGGTLPRPSACRLDLGEEGQQGDQSIGRGRALNPASRERGHVVVGGTPFSRRGEPVQDAQGLLEGATRGAHRPGRRARWLSTSSESGRKSCTSRAPKRASACQESRCSRSPGSYGRRPLHSPPGSSVCTPAGPSLNCVDPLVPGRTVGGVRPTTAGGCTTSSTGLARGDRQAEQGERIVRPQTQGADGEDAAPPRRQRQGRRGVRIGPDPTPADQAARRRGRASGATVARSRRSSHARVLRRSFEAQRRQRRAAGVHQLDQEVAPAHRRRPEAGRPSGGARHPWPDGRAGGPRRGRWPRAGPRPRRRGGGPHLRSRAPLRPG